MKRLKSKTELCRVSECQNHANNTYKKWQLDLCLIHLIEFIKWFIKNEKIIATFDRFCEKSEFFKNSSNNKAKKKIRQKIAEIQIYFENQRGAAVKFKQGEKIMTNWQTIEQLKTKLIDCLKVDITMKEIKENYNENEYLIEQLEQHIDQAIAYNDDQYKIINHYGYWNINENDITLAQLFDNALADLKQEVWTMLENELLTERKENEFEL